MIKKALLGIFFSIVGFVVICLIYKFSDEPLNPDVSELLAVTDQERAEWSRSNELLDAIPRASEEIYESLSGVKAPSKEVLEQWTDFVNANKGSFDKVLNSLSPYGMQTDKSSFSAAFKYVNQGRYLSKLIQSHVCFLKQSNFELAAQLSLDHVLFSLSTSKNSNGTLVALINLGAAASELESLHRDREKLNAEQLKRLELIFEQVESLDEMDLLKRIEISEAKLLLLGVAESTQADFFQDKQGLYDSLIQFLVRRNSLMNSVYSSFSADKKETQRIPFQWFPPQAYKNSLIEITQGRREDNALRLKDRIARLKSIRGM